jgi:hypothetical protein
VVVTHISNRLTFEGSLSLMAGADGGLKPISAIGTAKARQKQYGPLAEIIELLNELFGSDVREEDKIAFILPFDEIMTANQKIVEQAANNDTEQFLNAGDYPDVLGSAMLEAKDSVAEENDRQSEAVKTIVDRFFKDKEAYDRFHRVYGTHLHRKVNDQRTQPPQNSPSDIA